MTVKKRKKIIFKQKTTIMELHKQLKELRILKKYTQDEVARGIDVTQAQLSLIENNRRAISQEMLNKLSIFYKVPYQLLVWTTLKERNLPNKFREEFKSINTKVEALTQKILNQ